MRRRRIDRIGRIVGPKLRFAAGTLMLPPFLLMDSLMFRAVLAVLFAVLAVLAGKKLRWGYFALLILSVVFFHLLSPWGRVLFEIGPFPVTSGALQAGFTRGLTLTGMVFLSVATVRPELELPGRLGGLLGRTFYYFDLILEGRGRLNRKAFFRSLDDLLMERFDPNWELTDGTGDAPDIHVTGGILPAVFTALVPWVLWVLTIFRTA